MSRTANDLEDEDKVKEMYDLTVHHVDAVDKPASGRKFIVLKAESGDEGPSLDEMLERAKVAKADNDKLHEQAESRAKKYGISFKDGKGHLTPPSGKPTDANQYGDPVNYAYPIDDSHIQAAVSYFNHDGQQEAGGYSSSEWAIIGKRIARAVGVGYSYADGKIETPSNKESAKKELGDDSQIVPGSPEWEQHDAELMEQATSILVTLKDLVNEIRVREQTEVDAGHGDDTQQVIGLLTALDNISDALKEVAAVTATEQSETVEDVEKAKNTMTKEQMKKAHDTMMKLCKAAGCKDLNEFHKACKDAGCCDDNDPDDEVAPDVEDSKKAKGEEDKGKPGKEAKEAKKTEGDLPNTDKSKPKADAEPNGDKPQEDQKTTETGTEKLEKEKAKKSATSESLVAESVQKALKAAGLDQLGDKLGELLKVTKSVGSLEERIKKIENQPMPGGPVLRGAAQTNDYYLVRKGQGPDLNQPGVLEKAAEQVSDPYLRNVLQREVAKSLHPAMKNK